MKNNFEAHEPCVACGQQGEGMVCYHHVLSQKAWPELVREKWNLIPVCQKHHNEFHANGTSSMASKFRTVDRWLKAQNWFFCIIAKKWRHELEEAKQLN